MERVARGTDLNSSSWRIELFWGKYATTTNNKSFFVVLKRSPQYAKSCRKRGGTTNHAQVELLYSGSDFNHFKSASCDELSDLVPRSTLKSCMLDPIPGSVHKNCYDLLLPFITKVVNCSLQNSTLTSDMKRAIVRPSLKKPSLDYQLCDLLQENVH